MKQLTRTIPADLETPVGIYLKIRDPYPCSALLESSDYHTSQNSVSIVGVDPIGEFRVAAGEIRMSRPGMDTTTLRTADGADPVEELKNYIAALKIENARADVADGLLGFTAYDAVRYFERIEIQPREPEMAAVPDMLYIFYRFLIVLNHYRSELTIVENCPEGEEPATDRLLAVLHNNNIAQYPFEASDDVESSMTDEDFKQVVAQCVGHARRGDIFQIVPSRRFSQGFSGDDFCVYRALRCINPSPYLFYFDFGDFRVFGSSPETHLRIEGNTAYIDPIAGTFRRTGDDERDKQLAAALLEDAKENAEHIMLVDLARNDLSRSGGKVEIEFLKQIQYYSHVIHMVSRVKATLPADADHYRLMAATFPAGTLSGAPKVRAMEIINALEPHSRVVYGGCIGYLGLNGDINQAITIRSFLSLGGRLYSQAGAGIVARSNPESELQETRNKLGALMKAIERAKDF